MRTLGKRIARLEGEFSADARLLVVKAAESADIGAVLASHDVECRKGDTLVHIKRPDSVDEPEWVAVHEKGLRHLLASIDGKSRGLPNSSVAGRAA